MKDFLSSRSLWLVVVLLALGGAGTAAFFATHHREEREDVVMSEEAQRDAYLHARLLLQRLGVDASSRRHLGAFPDRSGVVLALGLSWEVSHARWSEFERLSPWILRGGHLVITAPAVPEGDKVLEFLGLTLENREEKNYHRGPLKVWADNLTEQFEAEGVVMQTFGLRVDSGLEHQVGPTGEVEPPLEDSETSTESGVESLTDEELDALDPELRDSVEKYRDERRQEREAAEANAAKASPPPPIAGAPLPVPPQTQTQPPQGPHATGTPLLGNPYIALSVVREGENPKENVSSADGEALLAVRVPYGDGTVTVVQESAWYSNRELERRQHAELLWRLARLGESQPTHALFLSAPKPGVSRLWHEGRYFFWGLVVLTALFVWSASRRFGPVLPEPSVQRRMLLEHVRASGRFLWERGQVESLMNSLANRMGVEKAPSVRADDRNGFRRAVAWLQGKGRTR